MKKILFLVFVIFILNINVFALDECTSEKLNNLRSIADKVELKYDYKMIDNNYGKYPEYTITASNLNADIKALIISDFVSLDYREFKNNGKGIGSLGGFHEGERVTVTIKAYTIDKCSTKTLATKQVVLPYYNRHYEEEFCKTNINFKYCQEFIDEDLTTEEYERAKQKYIDDNTPKVVEKAVDDGINVWIILGTVAGVILIFGIIYTIIVRRKKNSL